ncbi:MAG: hypothetical protein Ct9H300mP12_16250 [Acidimicrobiales bacterium]|nr:MAG: hypothetical protein Ct9H300mP12_16250 [Acidimicrobiales bacterium]
MSYATSVKGNPDRARRRGRWWARGVFFRTLLRRFDPSIKVTVFERDPGPMTPSASASSSPTERLRESTRQTRFFARPSTPVAATGTTSRSA